MTPEEKEKNPSSSGTFERRDYFQDAPVAYQSMNEDGKLIDVNRMWLELFGYSGEEVIGKPFESFLASPEDKEKLAVNFKEFKVRGYAKKNNIQGHKKERGCFFIEVSGKAIYDESGKYLKSHCVIMDRTYEKMVQKKIDDIARFPEANPNPVMRVSIKGKLLYGNRASMIFVKNDRYFDKDFNVCEEWLEKINGAMAEDKGSEFIEDVEGNKFSLTVAPVKEKNYCNFYITNISNVYSLIEELKISAQKWQSTFDSITDMIFIQDKEFNITNANKAFLDFTGKKMEDIKGKKCYQVMHKKEVPWHDCPFKITLENAQVNTRLVDDPVIGHPLMVTTSPIIDKKGAVLGSVHVAKDFSKEYMIEKEKKEHLRELEIFYEASIGREEKIMELKERINMLERLHKKEEDNV